MLSTQPASGFTSSYPKPCFNELYPHAQDRLGIYPGMFTGLHAPAPTFETWAWDLSEEMGIREVWASFLLTSIQHTEGASLL